MAATIFIALIYLLMFYGVIRIIIIIYLLILRVLHVQMLTRALQYNNYLTVHTQIRKKNYIVHFVTINNEEEKKDYSNLQSLQSS